MAKFAIKNLSKLAPFEGGPWNLPHKFHLYLIAFTYFFLLRVTQADHHITYDLWGLVKILIINLFYISSLKNHKFGTQKQNKKNFLPHWDLNYNPMEPIFVIKSIPIFENHKDSYPQPSRIFL